MGKQSMILEKLWVSLCCKRAIWHILALSDWFWLLQRKPKVSKVTKKCKRGIWYFQINDSRYRSCHFFNCITCLTHIGTFWLFWATFRGPIRLQWVLTHAVSIHKIWFHTHMPKISCQNWQFVPLFPLLNPFVPYRHFWSVFGYFWQAYKAPMSSDSLCEYS